jgi:hypothetical protein
MNIELFALCDAATEGGDGKINILGAFDTLGAREEPVVVGHCSIALRLRFKRIETGEHQVRIALVDADGRAVIPPFQTSMNVRMREPQDSAVANMVLNLQQVKLGAYGRYSIDLAVDGRQEGSLPFYVRRITQSTVEPKES